MNKSSKLLILIVTLFLLVSWSQVECRRTFSSRSSSSGRGNRGKNQPSGWFGSSSSWFGGSKSSSGSSGSSSGSVSKPSSSSTAKKNWQTATSHTSTQTKSNWANPHYKPAGASVPSAPREPSYGWKSTAVSNNKPGSAPYPSSNIGSRGYPVQTGVQTSQSNVGGFKPVSSSNFQPSQGHQTAFGGYHPAPSAPNTGFKPVNTYQPSHGYQPSHASVPHQSGYQPSTGQHAPSYNPSGYHAPSYNPSTGHHAPSYNPSAGHHAPSYPQQSYSGHYPSQSFSGYSSVPSYKGNKLYGGSSGHYGYPSSGGWGIDTYGSRKSSGTGKLLTGLAVGAAGGYLTSSLVNRISNPWKYSGYGYGSGYGYNSGYGGLGLGSGIGLGTGAGYGLTRDESAFERGFERGIQSRQNNENNKETPAPAAAPATPDDPTSKWVHCVAFDPQTQQTLINPNCTCTVVTSTDERTGQPVSVHQCSTLNGMVMQPIPVHQPYQGANLPPPPGVNLNGPPGGVNSPGAVPSYGNAYELNSPYGAGPGVYLPLPSESKPDQTTSLLKTEGRTAAVVSEKGTTDTTEKAKTEETNKGTVVVEPEMVVAQNVTETESVTAGVSELGSSQNSSEPQSAAQTESQSSGGLAGGQENHKNTAEFYGRLQKIVNMGNFIGRL